METVAKAVHSNHICMGCLSHDRLLDIVGEGIKRIYYIIINEHCSLCLGYGHSRKYCKSMEPTCSHCGSLHMKAKCPELQVPKASPLLLCWECVSNIARYMTFRRQCIRAHGALLQQMLTPGNLTSLSKLSIVKNNRIIKLYHTSNTNSANGLNIHHKCEETTHIVETKNYNDEENTKYHKSNNYEVKTDSDNTISQIEVSAGSKISLSTGDWVANVSATGETVKTEFEIVVTGERDTDIQFIKIEEDATFDVDDYEDDVIVDRECDSKITNIAKVKSKRSKESDFDDSDEEPLDTKKRKKIIKQRKRKKKKNNDEPKTRKTRKKREKPAGVVSNLRVSKKLQQLNIGEGQLEMVVLSWEQVEEERQKALSNIVFTRHEYRCPDCVVGFNHKFKLENHMKKHDSKSAGDMVCSVCKVRCRDADALGAHRRRHRVRWRCCLCGDTSSRASVAADHVAREHHASAPTHTCNVCGHAEPTLSKLRNHVKNHGERQKCNLCSKTFRDRTSLRTHLFIHGGEKEYACPVCDKRFLFKKAMEVHMVTHDAPAHLYCYQCDMTFKNRISYTQHMRYSLKHIDPAKLKFACPVCDKRFAKAARLQEHHVAVHTKATPIACSLPGCSFTCSSRPVLRTHIRMVHHNARALRNHVCHTCGKAYTTKKNLEGHMRSHTGERPFSCALCPAAFGYEATLYNHNKLVHALRKVGRRPRKTSSTPQAPEPT